MKKNEAKSDKDIALVAHGKTHPRDVWVLDTGASYHMCPRREWFSEYEAVTDGKIKMPNDFACDIAGISSIKLRTHDDRVCTVDWSGDGVLSVYRGSDVILRGFIH
uniref:Retrovirus-related Pol polyprotein from transposon TNT 1-94-like beta-barrel domain-containing protein n=1 Tax=Brassica oleracea var. oleracea TaxID=109376 RepID=A0A0D2ZZI1_BRAOL